MTKKRAFLDKKNAIRFRLLPASQSGPSPTQEAPSRERFVPTQEHLDEQHKYGVFFDDDYDYTKHLKARDEKMEMRRVDEEEERVVLRAPKDDFFPPPPPSALFGNLDGAFSSRKKKEKDIIFDDDVERCLDNSDTEGCDTLDDNFIELAGGVADASFSFRPSREEYASDEEDEDDDDVDFTRGARYEFSGNSADLGFDDDEDDEDDDRDTVVREGEQRDIDDHFDKMLDEDYNEDQLGELDAEDSGMSGMLEPNDPRIKKMIGMKRSMPEYDTEFAKQFVRARMRVIEEKGEEKEKMETVEVDEGSRKRMKWDCESFATQYTNIFNHPAKIVEPAAGKLSRKALKRLDRLAKKEEEEQDGGEGGEDVEMMDDGESIISTVSTIRPKGETPEERRLRKAAIKEVQRGRRQEKKMNKVAFAEEHRRLQQANVGKMCAKPIL